MEHARREEQHSCLASLIFPFEAEAQWLIVFSFVSDDVNTPEKETSEKGNKESDGKICWKILWKYGSKIKFGTSKLDCNDYRFR
jgi:hypothetical protein